MKEAGAFLTTSESMIFYLCKDTSRPHFKSLQKIVNTLPPDSGLLIDKEAAI